jgi:hypothetical protein
VVEERKIREGHGGLSPSCPKKSLRMRMGNPFLPP